MKTITVFGPSKADEVTLKLAYDVGRALAKAGFAVMNGGFAGTMEESARGARSLEKQKGHTIGVTMLGRHRNPFIQEERKASLATNVAVPTNSLEYGVRLGLLLESQGFIAIAGDSFGTFIEVLVFSHLRNKGLIKTNLAVVGVTSESAEISGEWLSSVSYLTKIEPDLEKVNHGAVIESLGLLFTPHVSDAVAWVS